MKIYPSTHKIEEVSKPNLLDIQLAHIEQEYYPKNIEINIDPKYLIKSKRKIIANQEFDTDQITFFDKNKKKKQKTLKRVGDKFFYQPDDIQEFRPTEFTLNLLCRRNSVYSPSEQYNLKIGFYQTKNSAKNFIKAAMPLFGDAPFRKVAPANITVNNASIKEDDFATPAPIGYDTVFVASSDGLAYKSNNKMIDFDSIFSQHNNIWITVSSEGGFRYFERINKSYTVSFKNKDVIPYDENIVIPKAYGVRMKSPNLKDFQESKGYRNLTQEIFGDGPYPVCVYEKLNHGLLVISHENILQDVSLYNKFLYNMFMYLHLNSYFEAEPSKTFWITDDKVQYMGSNLMTINDTQQEISLKDIIDEPIYGYDVYTVSPSNPNVFLSQKNGDELRFSKLSRTDPQKLEDSISIFTEKHTILQFKDPDTYTIEEPIQINQSISDNACSITLLPFISSKHNIIIDKEYTFDIEDFKKEYALIIVGNKPMLVEVNDVYTKNEDTEVARVKVEFEGEPIAFDIRQSGGGLPEKIDDFDMLDIGSENGRPYRAGVAAIIKLPKKYEKYDEKIRAAVEAYKVAADKFYILYEERSD